MKNNANQKTGLANLVITQEANLQGDQIGPILVEIEAGRLGGVGGEATFDPGDAGQGDCWGYPGVGGCGCGAGQLAVLDRLVNPASKNLVPEASEVFLQN